MPSPSAQETFAKLSLVTITIVSLSVSFTAFWKGAWLARESWSAPSLHFAASLLLLAVASAAGKTCKELDG